MHASLISPKTVIESCKVACVKVQTNFEKISVNKRNIKTSSMFDDRIVKKYLFVIE